MVVAVSHMDTETRTGGLGLRHTLLVYTSPRSLFERIEDTGAYGWALATMLVLVMVLGMLQIQSGLIDRVIDQGTEDQKAAIEAEQANLVDRVELRENMEAIDKQAVFNKKITRLGVVVLNPLRILASFLLISSVLYAVVALTGRKPEWHTLMSICVYAGFIELAAEALRVGMMFYYGTLDVDTSMAALWTPEFTKGISPLAGVDPFRIWFWVLAGLGLAVTRQLSRRMAIVMCGFMCVGGMGLAVAMEFATNQ